MIFLIADVHSDTNRYDAHITRIEDFINRPLGAKDTIICLGDLLGQSSRNAPSLQDKLTADRKFLRYLAAKPYAVACVMGNHDDRRRLHRLHAKPAQGYGEAGYLLANKVFYFDDGKVYDIPVGADEKGQAEDSETVSILALGGAFGHMYRFKGAPLFKVQQYLAKYLPLIYATNVTKVDYVLSHDVPSSRAGWLVRNVFGLTPINDFLDAIEDSLVFHKWYFGHHHLDLDPHSHYRGIYRREAILRVPADDDDPFNGDALE